MIVITLDGNSIILYDTTSPTHYSTTSIPGIIHIKLCAHVQIFIVYDLFGVFLTVRRVSPTKENILVSKCGSEVVM